jgi:prepilin-type N-terminal cleavage/methylation domain-containing protein
MTRRAFTLIEMLVSLAITLIMMGAVVALFGTVADSVSNSRALLEASDRLRACRNRLQADLQCATASMNPPLRPENGEGYFEISEGGETDGQHPSINNTLFGDTDDALLLTVRSRGEPFVGKANLGTAESQVAEVVYFLKQDGPVMDAVASPPIRLFTLYRRCMLVSQEPTLVALMTGPPPASIGVDFYNTFDVSARVDPVANKRVPNTLGDLTKPENRFYHVAGSGPSGFPYRFIPSIDPTIAPKAFLQADGRLGDDVILTNVLAFDVQVYDPGAPIYSSSGTAVEPRDQGYSGLVGGTPIGYGAYVDLGYAPGYSPGAGAPQPVFNQAPPLLAAGGKSGITARPYAYDTWSWHYENDGLPQYGSVADGGTNGLDDGGAAGVVDDIDERDTTPPYPVKLRGVRVTVRIYEPSSQQVRQVTVVQDFLPD